MDTTPLDDTGISPSEDSPKGWLVLAVERMGGQTAAAKALGIRQGAVWNMLKRGRAPAERVIPIEQLSGVPRHRLRPDLYPQNNAA